MLKKELRIGILNWYTRINKYPFKDHLVQRLAQAGPPRAGCSGLCLDSFQISPKMKTLQALWQPVALVSRSHRKEKKKFPDVQTEFPVFKFMPITSRPVTGHH